MRLTWALCGLLGLICLGTLLAVATGSLTTADALDLFLVIGSPVVGLTAFAVGYALARRP